jgi:hypothetical protein
MRIDPTGYDGSDGTEYRIAFEATNAEESACYTTDVLDAYQTGVQMARASRRKDAHERLFTARLLHRFRPMANGPFVLASRCRAAAAAI